MYKINDGETLVVVKIDGVTNYENLTVAIEAAYSVPGYFQKNNIWIFPKEFFEVKVDQLDLVTDFILERYPQGIPAVKSALVVPPGFNMAIIEVWATSAYRLPYAIKVFSSLHGAEDWTSTPLS